MRKYMCIHTVPANSFTRQQCEHLAKTSQQDPNIRGYRSFLNLSEGKIVCIVESPDQPSVENWFRKMNVPWDNICPVELEGNRGEIEVLPLQYPQPQTTNARMQA